MNSKKQKASANRTAASSSSLHRLNKPKSGSSKSKVETASKPVRPMRFDALVIAKKDLRFNREEAYSG